ncbi:hypothetical protein Daus18300_000562 [Diaporthe australafricana]|uniref:Heterokaryon incompatibility domain-containing protein n=1 Tax=Diaporthe australafricana TaxID=127596 RepID=A0ABR3Y3T1_9PEZI
MWTSRVWTLQEAFVSRQVIFAVQDQLIDGDFISELLSYAEKAENGITDKFGCYRWDPKLPVVVGPQHIWMEKEKLVIIRSIFGGEQQYAEICSRNGMVLMPFEEALAMLVGRSAQLRQDYVYGVLGMSIGGEHITPEYGISRESPLDWRKMLNKLKDTGMITERQLAAPSVNEDPAMSWLPKVEGYPYGPFLSGERTAIQVSRPQLSWTFQGTSVIAVEFKWVEVTECDDGIDRLAKNVNKMACHCVNGRIKIEGKHWNMGGLYLESDGVYLNVAGTSCYDKFTRERLEGTQVMLCENLGHETISMRVSGDVHEGRVQREDGYVLEIYWPDGHPLALTGKRLVVGSI